MPLLHQWMQGARAGESGDSSALLSRRWLPPSQHLVWVFVGLA
jgi:hypothetical protein